MAASLTPRLDRLEKNLVMNGGFRFWQRGGDSVAVNTTTGYTYAAPDRWLLKHTGTFTGTPNVVKEAVAPNTRSRNSLKWTFQRNASTAVFNLQQRIESSFVDDIVTQGTGSLGYWVKPSVSGGTAQLILAYATALDNHASQTTFYTSSTISLTSGVWNELKFENLSINPSSVNGLAVILQINLGSATDGATQTINVTQVMANSGTSLANFERAGGSIAAETALCQRYFEKSYSLDTAPATNISNGMAMFASASLQNYAAYIPFAAQKRSTPTLAIWDRAGNPNKLTTITGGAVYADNITTSPGTIPGHNERGISYLVAGQTGTYLSSGFHWTADAEIN